MTTEDYAGLNDELCAALGLDVKPIAIAFAGGDDAPAPRFRGTMPAPGADGRTGSVAAGCVFWMLATEAAFATTAADHANCSVGSVTHGFKRLDEVVDAGDVAALLASRWVSPEAVGGIPAVAARPSYVIYAPLGSNSVAPDVIFLRLNGKQLMALHEACPDLRFEGKPQCHIIPLAKEHGVVAVSSGCMLSRVRTGMSNNEVTCAIPARLLGDVVRRLMEVRDADRRVAAYASEDAKRFAPPR